MADDELQLFDEEDDDAGTKDPELVAAIEEARGMSKEDPALAPAKDDDDDNFAAVFQDDGANDMFDDKQEPAEVLPPSADANLDRLLIQHNLVQKDYMMPDNFPYSARPENDKNVITFGKSLVDVTLDEAERELRKTVWFRYQSLLNDLHVSSSVKLSQSFSDFYQDDSRYNAGDSNGNSTDITRKSVRSRKRSTSSARLPDHFIRKPILKNSDEPVDQEVSSVLRDTFAKLDYGDVDDDDFGYMKRIHGEGEEAVNEELDNSADLIDKRQKISCPFLELEAEEGDDEEEDDGGEEDLVFIHDDDVNDKGKD
jgi:hypothetical protein